MKPFRQEGEPEEGAVSLVLPLSALDRSMLPIVGGKAANLGELIRAGFSVPAGFCITTAAYTRVCAHAGLDAALSELTATPREKGAHQAELAAAIRTALLETPLPAEIGAAVTSAYGALSPGEPLPVAVRSSATAEDLPAASFAGQQETYLNIIGAEYLLQAVQQCFASLWTDRAVNYRASLGIDPRTVHLAVVVQRMVEASTAGVLFTVNPLTGKRRQAVIDANPGLGEAVVSGVTNPDHFVVNTPTGEIVERRFGGKQVVIQAAAGGGTQTVASSELKDVTCLTDTQLRMLVKLGAQVEAHYGTPQDIEWAIDAVGHIFLLQARPITTLFPLPADAPSTDEHLRVYLSFNVQQGTFRPFTPMGISAVRVLAGSLATLVGSPPSDPLSGPGFVIEAASRVFLDMTAALRSSFGRTLLVQAMSEAEVHAATTFQYLFVDPRLSLRPTARLPLLRAFARLLARTRLPFSLFQVLLSPGAARARLLRFLESLHDREPMPEKTEAGAHLSAAERLLSEQVIRVMTTASPLMVGGMQTLALARKLLGERAKQEELQIVLRGLPANPTTEMNLALWQLAEQVSRDPAMMHLVQETPAGQLAEDYRRGNLPPRFQRDLEDYLSRYGHRSVSELDLGMPRWSEDPTYVLGILASFLQLHERAQSPDAQYRRAAEEAEEMVRTLTRRARQKSWLRGLLVGFCLRRTRALAGSREMPRFCVTLVLAKARAHLWPVGEALVRSGRLSRAEDIFFLTFPEAHAALEGRDLRTTVGERRASFERELARRHVPLVLLSDGTEPSIEQDHTEGERETLRGVPASPGSVTATARVILDPHGARLQQGEILVAPSTDPGWTPLFFTAGALVMETGGAMAHGAIVAREYGIPAVVGVPGATERIKTGSRMTVNGTTGTITLEPAEG